MRYWQGRAREVLGEATAARRSSRSRKKLYYGISTWDYVFSSGLFAPEFGAELGYDVDTREVGDYSFRSKAQRREFYNTHFATVRPWLVEQLTVLDIDPYSGGAFIYDSDVREIAKKARRRGGKTFAALARAMERIADTR